MAETLDSARAILTPLERGPQVVTRPTVATPQLRIKGWRGSGALHGNETTRVVRRLR